MVPKIDARRFVEGTIRRREVMTGGGRTHFRQQ